MGLLAALKQAVLADDAGEQQVVATQPAPSTALATKGEGPAFQMPIIDGPDLLMILAGGGALYETGTPVLMLLAIAQYFLRRGPSSALWLAKAIFGDDFRPGPSVYRLLPGVARALPPAPVEELPAEVGASKAAEKAASPTKPVEVLEARPEVRPGGEVVWTTEKAIKALPKVVLVSELKAPKSTTAVPLGVNHLGQPVWADLMADLLHVGIYGTSGAGKDTLLRVWFATLTARTAPEELQFAFIDGKGDWLTPDLANLACMFIQPAGGYGDKGKLAILAAIKAIDAEAERRQELIFPNGCRTREQYNALAAKKGWKPLPLLVVVASDVMDSVAGEVEELLASLVSKARALGIRVIASMPTPTGKSMTWRMNLSSVLAGALVDGTQDAPALGVREVKDLPFRPSQVPPPPKEKGVFVAKVRGEFMVLRTPIFLAGSDVSEEHFNRTVAGLPQKGSQVIVTPSEPDVSEDAYLAEMMARYGGSVKGSAGKTAGNFQVGKLPGKQFPAQPNADFQALQETADPLVLAANLWKTAPAAERRKTANALHRMAAGAGKVEAITEAFGVSSGRNYQDASRLIEAAKLLIAARKG